MKKRIKTAIYVLAAFAVFCIVLRSDIDKGVCLDDEGNGQIYTDSEYNYINYKYTDAQKGDELITYELLNPLNNACDDIVLRIDYNKTTQRFSIR